MHCAHRAAITPRRFPVMSRISDFLSASSTNHSWLITGGAGFIGSHLVETLLRHGHKVTVLDNFSTGHRHNLETAAAASGGEPTDNLRIIDGDLTKPEDCRRACRGATHVLHLAALGSVPLSMEQPVASHDTNVSGMVHLLQAAREAGVKRLVYSSSSAVYGDGPGLPKTEDMAPAPLSPYAASKWIDEIYANIWHCCYQLETVGLRYFNVFGPRQDPAGAYAAVIPAWVDAMIHGRPVTIHGDGLQTRDFCYVGNVVEANLLAALTTHPDLPGAVCNIATGGRITLLDLHAALRDALLKHRPEADIPAPIHGPPRPGDIVHSQADIARARELLGYTPATDLAEGLDRSMQSYLGG